ncbi:MAG: hypothetical protein R3B09_17580 [Nannocystaceae bacterium]
MKKKSTYVYLLFALSTACAEGEGTGPSFNPTTATITGASGPTSTTSTTAESESEGESEGESKGGTSGPGTTTGATTTAANTSSSTTGGVCGDGVRDFGEECDGDDLVGKDCQAFGWDDGTLACNPDCTFFTDACFGCGDGVKDMAEACDGEDLGGRTCASEGFGGGSLICDADCKGVDTSGCSALPTCGDGSLNGSEQCDGGQLGGQTCVGLGFDDGALACTPSCTYDTSGCTALECAGQGEVCIFDENNLQSNCCPPGVKGNVLGICDIILCL